MMGEAFSLWGGGWSGTIIPFLFILTLIIFFHELGHYLVGRWCSVRITTFSIGFGPEIWGVNDRHGTRWRIAAIPLGGYVKFFGDLDGASTPDHAAAEAMSDDEKKVSFPHQVLWKRAAIVAAGPIASFLLGFLIFSGANYVYGRVLVLPKVTTVEPASPAEKAGFQIGDLIITVNSQPVESFLDVQKLVAINAETALTFGVERGSARLNIIATPILSARPSIMGQQRIGFLGLGASRSPETVRHVQDGLIGSIYWGGAQVLDIVSVTISYMDRLFAGKASVDQLSGPIGIAKMSGEAAKASFSAVLSLAAVLTVSVGFLNLLPIPMLDGGHLALYLIEAVYRRPLPPKIQDWLFRLGLMLVLGFSIWVFFMDIQRIRN